ncbi:MAG: hypothetical protein ACP5I1_04970, partial [Candidatus Hinthialibacter sp.]
IGLSLLVSFFFCLDQQFFRPIEENAPFHGGFLHKDYYLTYLICLCPFIASGAAKAKRLPGKAAGYSLLTIIAVIIVAAGSLRGMVLMIGMVFFCFAVGIWRLRFLNWIFPLIALGALQLYRSDIQLADYIQPWLNRPGVQEQIQNHLLALNIFGNHPFLGVGWGQLESFIEWSANGMPPMSEMRLESSLITFMVDTGILGALGLIWLWITVFHASLTPSNSSEPSGERARAAQASCLVLGAAFLAQDVHLHLFTWCWLGVLYGTTQNAEDNRSDIKS